MDDYYDRKIIGLEAKKRGHLSRFVPGHLRGYLLTVAKNLTSPLTVPRKEGGTPMSPRCSINTSQFGTHTWA